MVGLLRRSPQKGQLPSYGLSSAYFHLYCCSGSQGDAKFGMVSLVLLLVDSDTLLSEARRLDFSSHRNYPCVELNNVYLNDFQVRTVSECKRQSFCVLDERKCFLLCLGDNSRLHKFVWDYFILFLLFITRFASNLAIFRKCVPFTLPQEYIPSLWIILEGVLANSHVFLLCCQNVYVLFIGCFLV